MGSWFSNLHIRKDDNITQADIVDYFVNRMKNKGYCRVETSDDADTQIVFLTSADSQWISVLSHMLVHDDPESCAKVAEPISAALETDVLCVSCFDSDYLYLNLINTKESLNGWVGIGRAKAIGITRRNNLTAWKKKVLNYPAFSEGAKKKYVLADSFLAVAEPSLGISNEQISASLEYLHETEIAKGAEYLYFRSESSKPLHIPYIQIAGMHPYIPCFPEKEHHVSFINTGHESRGLSVYFLGPYVENDEITFSNVKLRRHQCLNTELELQKFQLPDGQWAYGYHDSEIMIPPAVPKRMDPWERIMLQGERMYSISFVPHGNPRKMLDITIVIIPDANPDNQAEWNIWHPHGSKAEFIKEHNRIWKKLRAFEKPEDCLPLLNAKDFEE